MLLLRLVAAVTASCCKYFLKNIVALSHGVGASASGITSSCCYYFYLLLSNKPDIVFLTLAKPTSQLANVEVIHRFHFSIHWFLKMEYWLIFKEKMHLHPPVWRPFRPFTIWKSNNPRFPNNLFFKFCDEHLPVSDVGGLVMRRRVANCC